MPHLHAQVIFERSSGLPEDQVVNGFNFFAAVGYDPGVVGENILIAMENFYSDTQISGASIESFLHPALSESVRVKVYDRADPSPRLPIFDDTFSINIISGDDGIPEEVALVLSSHAAYVSGAPRARARNRTYLGPFNDNALGADANLRTRPSTTLVQAILEAAEVLRASGDVQWEVFSDLVVTSDSRPVVGGWVDDAFDTQRRRGVRASGRDGFGADA